VEDSDKMLQIRVHIFQVISFATLVTSLV